jgi:hypothetical protein
MENPGSDKAIEPGCTCPGLDNGHGIGSGTFWYSEGCRYHFPFGKDMIQETICDGIETVTLINGLPIKDEL